MNTYTSRYSCTLETLEETLDKYGVAVLPSLLDEEECDKLINTFWDNINTATSKWETPIDKEDPETWDMRGFQLLHGMLSQHNGIGHWPLAWKVRTNPKVMSVFGSLWNCKPEKLLTSFDGMSISLPPEDSGRGWHREKWFHCDTNYCYNEKNTTESKRCYQAWVTPIKVRKGDATLAVLEGSHEYHKKFSKKKGLTSTQDWYKLTDDEVDIYVDKYGCKEKRIKCPAGSMVIWDSRTIHYGQQPFKERAKPNIRICIYVCMMPRKYATEKQLKKRIEIFENGRMTTHHPIKSKLFPEKPRSYGNEMEEILKFEVKRTKRIERLVGY